MDLLQELENLSLVSHVSSLIENYLNISDSVLAEFFIDLAKNSPTIDDFKQKLSENDAADLPAPLIEGIYKHVCEFCKSQVKNEAAPKVSREEKLINESAVHKFSSLAIPDGAVAKESGRMARKDSPPRSNVPPSKTHGQFSRKRLSSPERWELKQLVAAGALDPSVLVELEPDANGGDENADSFSNPNGDLTEKEFIVELNHQEPHFLKGQTKISVELSPVRIIKNPEGSLNRAAISAANLARERKELKIKTARAEKDVRTLETSWQDPLADASQKRFAQDRSSAKSSELPEWKRMLISNTTGHRDQSVSYGLPHRSKSIREQRRSLPIFQFRKELVAAVRSNQILVIVGDTGSGKTTQLTQYLAEDGFTAYGKKIACTQPRRVAATSVAKRVAEEVGCRLGEDVGYTIRFEDRTSAATRIKYMTDGMLLRECLADPSLKQYSVIMLDEAHERTVNTDVLFGLLKKASKAHENLKIIVTSATLDAEKFSKYFFDCPIFKIPGRTFPVEIMYAKEPENDYLDGAIITVLQIHTTEPPGDILLFLTGQEEIDTACEILHDRIKALGPEVDTLIILPVYSALPSDIQSRIFEPAPPGCRKIVIATNIAETSVTIDGILYVIDPGFVKQKAYNAKLGMDSLVVTPISQAQARQRAGRAGRTGPGKCYRLYTENAYSNEMLPNSIPEIQRTNLANTVLTLKAMGINDLLHFDFMDPPPIQAMIAALQDLFYLGALDEDGLLTRLGKKMSEFPLEPCLSKMLIYSLENDCSEEVLTIVAMLCEPNVFYRPKDKQDVADQKKTRFHQSEGDHLTLLNVFNSWKNSGYSSTWAFENFVQARTLRRAQDIRNQLLSIIDRNGEKTVSCGRNAVVVQKAITAGFFMHAAKRDPTEGYKTVAENMCVFLHPSSCLFQKDPEWVVYHELVFTSREYMREITTINPKWLTELAPNYFRTSDAAAPGRRRLEEKIRPLHNKREGANDWRISKRRPVKVSQKF